MFILESTKKTVIVSVCGKGGVGKTSVSAVITKILCENKGAKVLAIDADPAIGLATALGIKVNKTVDSIRKEILETAARKEKKDRQSIVSDLDYEVFDALVEKGNLAFLAIGRPEDDGCFCKVNSLLKDIISKLAADFDYVIIDGEAGIEQVNRRVMETVTHLILVSDASAKGINVIATINDVAKDLIKYDEVGVILNRLRSKEEVNKVNLPKNIPLLAAITDNDELRDFDIAGKSILELTDEDLINSVKGALLNINIKY
ncbi:MAG: CO dehydrogenase maturation factor [Clostridium sp.]|jgi:CO dehydrogenase maturation factor